MNFKEWLEKQEAMIVGGPGNQKDYCVFGAPGRQHGQTKGPIKKCKK